ncbi:LysR substrate-binding domain-containing protein [Bifidobacterium tibiigranuli]|jgi:LysR family nitrogen assimilation transcriptional regulator|uniref:LysR substrate-binding domain-containing protein n=1 Tax=Bifidobacterium tibiigranuli TaxID=2172043 RepID=UPI0026F28DAE|nr:LysR substrate-binding domain-containing protein [Bifidobacterium tibiigranuli]MCI2185684.1 LysR substrate-binding domain-containing protein [Bifidobacterium tibiigranuli]MCI2202994.1 LysR substrate-binding domain-containing protein [Bifidobacterium tibiigranuli]
METRRLHQFIVIVDSASMTRAAQLLHVAQPALSQSIAILERDMNQQLLTRRHVGVVPTAAGWSLYRYAKDIVRLEETARQQVQEEYESPQETVTFGVAPFSITPAFMVRLVAEIKRQYPRITLRIVEALSVVHSQAVKLGQLDVALIYHPGPVKGVKLQTVLHDRLCFVAPRDDAAFIGAAGTESGTGLGATALNATGLNITTLDHSRQQSHSQNVLAAEPRGVRWADITDRDLILPRSTHTLRALVEQAYSVNMSIPQVSLELEHTAPLPEAVSRGIGDTILPSHVAQAVFDSEKFAIMPLREPSVEVRFALATSAEATHSRGTEVVAQVLRDTISDQEISDNGF